nr:fimbrial protein [Xenorhabdus lircayensis]
MACTIFWYGPSYADVQITVKGTLREPPCSVTGENGDKIINVNLMYMPLKVVGTPNAEKSFRLKVHCDSRAPIGKVLKMKVQPLGYGVIDSMGNNVLSTSMKGLGIALTYENEPVVLNSWILIKGIDSQADEPMGFVKLTARLVAENKLEAGEFQSAASLLMNYQ